jgi:hypothetical protein
MSFAKPIARSVVISGLALVLMGCPYESSEPLTTLASSVIDARLAGTWRCLMSSEDDVDRMTFTPFDEHQYVVAFQDAEEEGKVGLLRAYAGRLGEASFLSIQELGSSADGKPPGWTWVRYSIVDGDLLRLRIVESELLDDKVTPAEARAIVEKHLDSPELYDGEPSVCVRVAEPES